MGELVTPLQLPKGFQTGSWRQLLHKDSWENPLSDGVDHLECCRYGQLDVQISMTELIVGGLNQETVTSLLW